MLKHYERKRIRIYENNLTDLTGLNVEEVYSLSGILAYKSIAEIQATGKIAGDYPMIQVNVKCNDIKLVCGINVKDHYIYNQKIEIENKGNGIGAQIFEAQVNEAIKHRFKEIRCYAWGSYAEIDKFNGYITWGRFGFEMVEKNNQPPKKYIEFLSHEGKNFMTIFELLNTVEGKEVWTKKGFPWDAIFYLSDQSDCRKNFELYKKSKYS